MSYARVYLSIFPSERSEEIVKNINDNMKSIRFELLLFGKEKSKIKSVNTMVCLH